MTDTAISSFAADRSAPRAPTLWQRVRQGLANWLAEVSAVPQADPLAQFSTREWADLPVHHPASDAED